MADRTVSARLRADVSEFIAQMRAAQQAAERLNRELRRTGDDFEQFGRGAQRLERELQRLLETERQEQQQQRQSSEQTRRSTEQTRRNTEETRRNSDETRRRTEETRRSRQETSRQTEETRRNTEQTERQRRATERLRDERGRFTRGTRENTRSQNEHSRSIGRSTSAMESAVGAALLLGAAETSAAVALGSFGLLAAPSIAKVVTAQEDLAAGWDTLSPMQRAVALEVRDLGDGYQALAASFEPQAMGAFNSVLSVANTLLPRFSDVAGETAVDVQRLIDRIGGFATGPEMNAFLDNMSQQAPRALDELGTAATTTGSLALQLATDLTPVGLSFLSVANGALGMVNGLAHVNPLFAQFAITALLLRSPITAIYNGIGTLTTRLAAYTAATRGATLATRALSVATALGPVALVAGAAALFLWASRAGQARTASQRLADSLQVQHQAVGNNLAGYQRLVTDLMPRLEAANNRLSSAQDKVNDRSLTALQTTDKSGGSYKKAAEEAFAYGAKLDQAATAIRNVENTSLELSRTYGITTEQAQRLATAAGVDLSKAVDKNGNLTFDAAQKIRAYQIAVQNASSPTHAISLALDDAGNEALQMKDRVTALTSALDAAFNPSLQVFQATTQMKQGFRDLTEQLGQAKNGMAGNDAASLRLQQQFANQLSTVRDLASATLTKTHNMDAARSAVAQQLPLLYALAGRNREARAQVDALARSLGINTGTLRVSRAEFITQATAMLGSRRAAEQLWQSYQRLTAAQRGGTGTLGVYISRVQASATQARISALRTSGAAGAQGTYNARVQQALPVLYALAGRNASARAQVDALARATGNATGATNVSRRAFLNAASAMGVAREKALALWHEMNKIKSRRVKIDVNAKGMWVTAHDPGRRIPGLAAGGPVPAIGPESTEAYDSVPALLRVNEHVWTPEEVRSVGGHGAMMRMRALARAGQLQGFAVGGPVNFAGKGSVRGDVGTVMRPVHSGMDSLVDRIGDDMAAQWKKFLGSGGPVVAAARTQLGVPYVWGGTAWGRGLDCSGLTSGAWQRGGHVWIGRTTYQQFPNSSHLSGPKPGALGFPHMGHVVLATGRGTIIEAPYTGARVRERGISRNYEWRWPNAARFAEGGPVTHQQESLGRRFLTTRSRSVIEDAKLAGVAGDPGNLGIPGFATGGRVRGAPGRDRNLIAATDGEFVVAAAPAAEHGPLLEALNAGRVGQALIAPTITAAASVPAGGATSARAVHVHVTVANHGVITSRMEAENWLAKSLDQLDRDGRVPWARR